MNLQYVCPQLKLSSVVLHLILSPNDEMKWPKHSADHLNFSLCTCFWREIDDLAEGILALASRFVDFTISGD